MLRKKINAADYLKNVLKTWARFCKTHRLFAESIETILKENEELRVELKKLTNTTT